jgi:cytoskeletal protein CcmA (bactofilin family)
MAGAGLATEQATLGATVVVKGKLSGAQAIYIDGRVEGSIHFPKHRVTVGRKGVVVANIVASEVVIMGSVTGNIDCEDRVDTRSDAVLTGDVVTQRISIDEGALVKGRVEVSNAPRKRDVQPKPEAPATEVVASEKKNEAPKMEVAAVFPAPPRAVGAAAPKGSVSRIAGSSVLFEEPKS